MAAEFAKVHWLRRFGHYIDLRWPVVRALHLDTAAFIAIAIVLPTNLAIGSLFHASPDSVPDAFLVTMAMSYICIPLAIYIAIHQFRSARQFPRCPTWPLRLRRIAAQVAGVVFVGGSLLLPLRHVQSRIAALVPESELARDLEFARADEQIGRLLDQGGAAMLLRDTPGPDWSPSDSLEALARYGRAPEEIAANLLQLSGARGQPYVEATAIGVALFLCAAISPYIAFASFLLGYTAFAILIVVAVAAVETLGGWGMFLPVLVLAVTETALVLSRRAVLRQVAVVVGYLLVHYAFLTLAFLFFEFGRPALLLGQAGYTSVGAAGFVACVAFILEPVLSAAAWRVR